MVFRGSFGCPSCQDSFGSIEALTSVTTTLQSQWHLSLIPHPSISGQNTLSYVPSAGPPSRPDTKRIKYVLHSYCVRPSHSNDQHHAEEHATPQCSECGREFGSQDAVKKVLIYLHLSLPNHLLMLPQHYNAKHCFECSECDDEFTTEAARDEVQSFRRISTSYSCDSPAL